MQLYSSKRVIKSEKNLTYRINAKAVQSPHLLCKLFVANLRLETIDPNKITYLMFVFFSKGLWTLKQCQFLQFC